MVPSLCERPEAVGAADRRSGVSARCVPSARPPAIMGRMGTLYVVGTPIGNLEDITLRAIRTLKEVHLIAAEDTRVTRTLLNAYQISTPLSSFHEFSGPGKVRRLVERLAVEDVALVSDAGTPGISDPGFPLIRAAIEAGIPVVPIPGP